MKIGEIINDSIRYPFTDWKTFLFLGLIFVLGDLSSITGSVLAKGFIIIFALLALILGIIKLGYKLRVMESTTSGNDIIPKLDKWVELFIDGIKVFVVTFVYVFPVILVGIIVGVIAATMSFGSGAHLTSGNLFITFGIFLVLIGLYLLIIYPIFYMALVNMAVNNRDIGAAFKFGDIKSIIVNIGLGNFIVWYIITGLIYLFLVIFEYGLLFSFNLVHLKGVGALLAALLIAPFIVLFINRSASLIYLNGYVDETKEEMDDVTEELEN